MIVRRADTQREALGCGLGLDGVVDELAAMVNLDDLGRVEDADEPVDRQAGALGRLVDDGLGEREPAGHVGEEKHAGVVLGLAERHEIELDDVESP